MAASPAMLEPDKRPPIIPAEHPLAPEYSFTTSKPAEGSLPLEETQKLLLDATRAARLRRIVRDGEEIVRRLNRLEGDLHREIPEVHHPIERGNDHATDLLSDISVAFDRAAFFASGQAKQAADRLNQAEQPLRFTHRRKSETTSETDEESMSMPLWKIFSEQEGAPSKDKEQ